MAWSNRGLVLGSLDRFEEMFDSCARAIEIDPHLAEAWYNKAVALVNFDRYREAITHLEEADRLGDPDAAQTDAAQTIRICKQMLNE
jgi:tetratricopeptide (TPR) repeat protein